MPTVAYNAFQALEFKTRFDQRMVQFDWHAKKHNDMVKELIRVVFNRIIDLNTLYDHHVNNVVPAYLSAIHSLDENVKRLNVEQQQAYDAEQARVAAGGIPSGRNILLEYTNLINVLIQKSEDLNQILSTTVKNNMRRLETTRNNMIKVIAQLQELEACDLDYIRRSMLLHNVIDTCEKYRIQIVTNDRNAVYNFLLSLPQERVLRTVGAGQSPEKLIRDYYESPANQPIKMGYYEPDGSDKYVADVLRLTRDAIAKGEIKPGQLIFPGYWDTPAGQAMQQQMASQAS